MSNDAKKNTPKLLLDEHIWAYLAKILRARGYDVIHATEVGLIVTPDELIMKYAVGEHRAVVTFNIKHYIPLSIQYFEDGKEHYGIVVSKALSQGELQRRVIRLLESVTAKELMNAVRYL